MTPELGLIIEPDALEAVMGMSENAASLRIIDVCQNSTYQQVHIPDAIHIDPAQLVCGIKPATGMLPSLSQLNALFSQIGYDPEHHYVVYDDEGGGWAGRFIWTLDVIGHRHYSYLNGGLHSWSKEGHPLTADTVTVATADNIDLSINNEAIAEQETVLAALDNDDIKIWDARSAEEYAGTKLFAQRGGHIPGAINLDWLDTMDKARNLRLLPFDQLREMLTTLGIEQQHEIITHCQSHHRSGLTYLIAKALGFKVKGYHGSWSQWGNNPTLPITTTNSDLS